MGYRYGGSEQETLDTHIIYIGGQDTGRESIKVPEEPKRHYAFFTSVINSIEAEVASALARLQNVQIVWDTEPSSNDRDVGIGIMLVALCKSSRDVCVCSSEAST